MGCPATATRDSAPSVIGSGERFTIVSLRDGLLNVLRGPLLPALLAGGCSFELPLSTLDPAGPGASSVATVWWVMFWSSMAITGAMIGLGLLAALRPVGRAEAVSVRRWLVGGGVMFPSIVLLALMLYGFGPGRSALPQDPPPGAFRVEVVAHQWWWEVHYRDVEGGPLYDANEMHVPVGRPIRIELTSADVIHSFWVPRLGGKMDAIPGHRNVMVLQADEVGVYRGQCSEFCGAQHARMGFHVEAHEHGALEAQLERLANRSRSADASDAAGARAYRRHCAACHSLDARSRSPSPGPNLAGLADRHRLGGGWLINDEETRRRWLREHQALKPGNRMPDVSYLRDEVLDAVAGFLEREE